MKNKPALFACALLAWPVLASAAPDPDPCSSAFQAQQARIERKYTSRPPGTDRDAQVQWSRSLHAELAGAEQRARQCQEDRRPKPGSAAFQQGLDRERQCTAKAAAQLAELERRFPGPTRSVADQRALREGHDRISDERLRCAHTASR